MCFRFVNSFLVSAVLALYLTPSNAEDLTIFRIGTGGKAGTYYPVGSLIAQAISNPPGSDLCLQTEECGVSGLLAVAQSSNGSVSNIQGILDGELEAGLVQADVAYFAYTATEIFVNKKPQTHLRAIASLYPEHMHIVARNDAAISSPAMLRDKRVSLNEPGSGTLVDARIVLEEYGLDEEKIEAKYIAGESAADNILDNTLDAFFIVAGYPTSSVTQIVNSTEAVLVPIEGVQREHLVIKFKYFNSDVIPANTYKNQTHDIQTISVAALLVTSASMEEEFIYHLTAALWNKNSRKILDNEHPRGKSVTMESAVDGIGIPLHPGSLRFYQEKGLLK
jgi:TRAP transporter TAXI family solute receptor